MAKKKQKITHAEVRMYRMGTGDCFVIKFVAKDVTTFTMMIDCGTWRGKAADLQKFIIDLKAYLPNNTVDLLVVTHEHKDHVYGFEACEALFTANFTVNNIWMAWTEDDSPGDLFGDQVQEWKKKFGQHKKALAMAATELGKAYNTETLKNLDKIALNSIADVQQRFSVVVDQFAQLHFDGDASLPVDDPTYIGGLKGMKIVKESIAPKAKNKITYCRPGQVIDNLEGAEGLRFYVLGPPTTIEAIQTESGSVENSETYSHSHNTDGSVNDSFATAILNLNVPNPPASLFPFDESYIATEDIGGQKPKAMLDLEASYNREPWRTIGNDWLNSAGSLALRMNSATNNLSLALAIEFTDSGRIMLFPGDAEYGSWDSWHTINWPIQSKDNKKTVVEELLNRTVFYKVAHHLSHNGSAKKRGVKMMTHPDLAAMATLDYAIISPGWKNTMPNRDLVQDLLISTKGRLMIMQEDDLFVAQAGQKIPLHDKIMEARNQMNSTERKAFDKAFVEEKLYLQYTIEA